MKLPGSKRFRDRPSSSLLRHGLLQAALAKERWHTHQTAYPLGPAALLTASKPETARRPMQRFQALERCSSPSAGIHA